MIFIAASAGLPFGRFSKPAKTRADEPRASGIQASNGSPS
jgi:hypothetical protein